MAFDILFFELIKMCSFNNLIDGKEEGTEEKQEKNEEKTK